MNHEQLANLLIPTTSVSKDEKWRAAWALLDELPNVPIEHRCHARCWLTYRAIDGHVSREEYERRVWKACEMPQDHELAPRWITSQAAAEFYLWTLWDERLRIQDAGLLLQCTFKEYPPAILSMTRARAICAYEEMILGQTTSAKQLINQAVYDWRESMTSFDWHKYPLRFADGKGDMMALHAIMCIAARLGMTSEWMKQHEGAIQCLNDPWVKCLKHLSRKEGAIWI